MGKALIKGRKTLQMVHRALKYLGYALAFCLGRHVNAETNLGRYFTEAEIKTANTGENAVFLAPGEKEILKIVNLARMYPQKFFMLYRDYVGKNNLRKNSYHSSLTSELQKMQAVNLLQPDKQMYESARCWATEAGGAGLVGHARKNCKGGFFAECCYYGGDDALGIVMCLLIDDGVESLGHRRICLSPAYSLVGISSRPHQGYGSNTVMDFTYGAENIYTQAKHTKPAIVQKKKTARKKKAVRKKKRVVKKFSKVFHA